MKKLFLALICLIFLIIAYNLSKQIVSALQASQRLDSAVVELSTLQKKNSELKRRLKEVTSPQFIEQQARDKLNQARPDEVVIIIPKESIDLLLSQVTESTPTPIPNWQGWLKLFFK